MLVIKILNIKEIGSILCKNFAQPWFIGLTLVSNLLFAFYLSNKTTFYYSTVLQVAILHVNTYSKI